MNRLNGWRFLEIGRRLERALGICHYAQKFASTGTAVEAPVEALDTLLELADSQITYRLRYVMVAARAPVLDLLLLDVNNPRALVFQITQLSHHLEKLPPLVLDGLPSAAQRLIIRLLADLRAGEAELLRDSQIEDMERALLKLSNEISLNYFTHRERSSTPQETFT